MIIRTASDSYSAVYLAYRPEPCIDSSESRWWGRGGSCGSEGEGGHITRGDGRAGPSRSERRHLRVQWSEMATDTRCS